MRPTRRQALGAAVALTAAPSLKANTAAKKVLVIVGPTNHPPGTHEIAASGRLLAHCVNAVPGLAAEMVTEWPAEAPKDVATVVFVGDMFPPEMMPHRDRAMNDLGKMMDAGCGIVCVHYATGLEAKHVSETGDHPLLKWMGGYFATRCTHHKSVAKVFLKATVEPTEGDHPVLRGWKPFTFHDEPYIQNWFGKDGPAKNVTAIATAMLPPEKPAKETIAWAVSRPDGGRGVGVVMPHFYRNWKLDDLRTLILNAITWSAKAEVPKDGVKVALPELTTFKPASVEPVVKKK
jgi:type 1 glutamine amidotransferase